MKIKLNRDLWNHKAGETFDIEESRGNWAVSNGHATEVETPKSEEPEFKTWGEAGVPQNKAIEPKYKRNKK